MNIFNMEHEQAIIPKQNPEVTDFFSVFPLFAKNDTKIFYIDVSPHAMQRVEVRLV